MAPEIQILPESKRSIRVQGRRFVLLLSILKRCRALHFYPSKYMQTGCSSLLSLGLHPPNKYGLARRPSFPHADIMMKTLRMHIDTFATNPPFHLDPPIDQTPNLYFHIRHILIDDFPQDKIDCSIEIYA